MKYIFTPILGLLLGLASFIIAPIGMFFLKHLIVWDAEPSLGSYPEDVTLIHNLQIRGDLPKRWSWFQTPDERFPGGMYEPAVVDRLLKKGRLSCSWYWAGRRNQLVGMAAYFGKPTTDYIPESNGFWQRGDIWRLSIPLGFGRIVVGWQVYKRLDGSFLAVPVFTLKRNI